MNYNVTVLMSTYNGERFLKEQIKSILYQEQVNVNLIIRDDGSTDDTISCIESFHDSRIKLIKGRNIGWKESFNYLLRECNNSDYYAFADQDDVWLSNKLISGIKKIEKDTDIPTLYYCDAIITNEELSEIGYKKNKEPFQNKLTNLFNCAGQGCCMVLNNKAKEYFCRYIPQDVFSHEAWISILCSYFGKVIYENKAYILYRQHYGENVNGAFRSSNALLFKKYVKNIKNSEMYPNYAKALYDGFKNDLSTDELKEIVILINYKNSIRNKLSIILNNKLYRDSTFGTIGLKLAFLLSWI